MRILVLVLLLAVSLTGALLWNKSRFAPICGDKGSEKCAGGNRRACDEIVLILGGERAKAAWIHGRGKAREERRRRRPGKRVKRNKRPQPPPALRKAILRKGDTVYSIARKMLGNAARYKEILELNEISEERAKRLKVGTVLLLPPR